jgi:LysM repeat protein
MKKSFILSVFLFISIFVFAQGQLIIHSNDKALYLVHTVKPKENFYSIGRLYSIDPKEIAAYNKVEMNGGLVIGRSLLIPLTEKNFSQTKQTGNPVYYVVGPKEGLYRVSQKNGTVLMADLRKWNKLSKDVITPGQKLIVGFLAPSENLHATAAVVNDVAVEKREEKVEAKEKHEEKVEAKEKIKQDETVITDQKEKENRQEKKVVISTPPVTNNTTSRTAVNDGDGGYFKSQFEQQVKITGSRKEGTGTSGIFKTASGWQDAKYYVLLDNVEPGTIVHISNPANNKSIYAKVLGGMSGIRQNQGYDLRISNAGASVLDIADTEKFIVKFNY